MKAMKRLFLFALLTLSPLHLGSPSAVHAQQKWERTYGGGRHDAGYSVQQTSDGGYIIAGFYGTPGGLWDYSVVYLIKTNASGDTLWTKTYEGTLYGGGRSVQQTSDGGYIIAGWTGETNSDVYLIKTNATGDTLWSRTYGGTSLDDGWSVQQTSDGGYIIAGWIYSFGGGRYDFYLIKTNASGDTLWTRTYGGTSDEDGRSVQQTSDGGYIIAGSTESFGAGFDDVYLIRTNASGDTLWTRTYGGARTDMGFSVQQTSDGGYIVAGYTDKLPGSGNGDVYLIKTNASGDTLWTRSYGGARDDWGYSVQQTRDGGYIIAGSTGSFGAGFDDVYLIRTNASGDTLWTRTYGGTRGDWGYSVRQTSDGGYIITGWTNSFGTSDSYDVYLIKTDANGSSGVEETAGVRDQGLGVRVTAKPNPFISFSTIPGHEREAFTLYDISGRWVGAYKGDRIGWDLSPGVYFLRRLDKELPPLRIVKVR